MGIGLVESLVLGRDTMRKFLVSAVMAAALVGCATSGTKITQEQLDQVVQGKTTRAEVVSLFGQPTSVSMNSDGTQILGWGYAHVGFAGIGTEVQGLSVVFDDKELVKAYTRTGSSPQPARLGN